MIPRIALILILLSASPCLAQEPGARVYVSGGVAIPLGDLEDAVDTGFTLNGKIDLGTKLIPNLRIGMGGSYSRWEIDDSPFGDLDGHYGITTIDGQLRVLTNPLIVPVTGVFFTGLGITYIDQDATYKLLGKSYDWKSTIDNSASVFLGAGIQTSTVFIEGSYRYAFTKGKTQKLITDIVTESECPSNLRWFELRIGCSWNLLD